MCSWAQALFLVAKGCGVGGANMAVIKPVLSPLFASAKVLTAADPENHINKTKFKVPFVCGAKNLGEALRRIGEGASMIRMKGKAGTGNLIEAVRSACTPSAAVIHARIRSRTLPGH